MPKAPDVDDPKYWQQRAKEARLLAETVKQTMLSVAKECERFAIKAAMCSIHKGRVIDETERS
jgi:hypothetical protein